jgi:hypothetical protein
MKSHKLMLFNRGLDTTNRALKDSNNNHVRVLRSNVNNPGHNGDQTLKATTPIAMVKGAFLQDSK